MGNIWIFLVVGALVLVLWGLIEVNKIKHKIYAIFAIGLLLFLVISGSFVFSGKNLDFSSAEGIFSAGKMYLSFLGVAGKNLFSLTSNAIKLDWTPEHSAQNSSSK